MSDLIRLEVSAARASLPVVRVIIGGIAARADLCLDELEDLYIAVEQLFCVASELDEGPRRVISLELDDREIRLAAGPFRSAALRARLAGGANSEGLDLGALLSRVMNAVTVEPAESGEYSVALVKQRTRVCE